MKKILKHTLRGLCALVAMLIAFVALLYLPAVQDFARRKAVGPLSKALGMELTVGQLDLRFPLRLSLGQILLTDRADTLVDCERIALEVKLWPLLRQRVVIPTFQIEEIKARYQDSVSGSDLQIKAAELGVEQIRAALRTESASIGRIALDKASVRMLTGKSPQVEKSDTTAPVGWRIAVEQLVIRHSDFAMRSAGEGSELSVELAEGVADSCRIDLGSQQVAVAGIGLDRGSYAYLTAAQGSGDPTEMTQPAASSEQATPDNAKSPKQEAREAEPWSIRVGNLTLRDNRLTYGVAGHQPTPGFDPAWIRLSEVEIRVDSIYNRGSDLALQIRQLAFTERCGLTVLQTRGRLTMGGEGIALSGFDLETADSRITADLEAGAGIMHLDPPTPLTAGIRAEVGTEDLARLYPTLLPATLRNRQLDVDLTAAGTLDDLGKIELQLSSPGHLRWIVDGRARYPLDPGRLTATARFRGDLRNGAFLLEMLPDTALRRRISLPRRIGLEGSTRIDRQNYTLVSELTAGESRESEGRMGIDGRFEIPGQRYDVTIRCDSFPVGGFLPKDSLGRVGMLLDARGQGFDPFAASTRSQLRLEIGQAEYRGRDFGGFGITADLEEHHLSGRIEDRDTALRLNLGVEGLLTEERQQARMAGRIGWFDLQALGFIREPIGGVFDLQAEALASRTGSYTARIALDSIRIRDGARIEPIRPTSFAFATDSVATRASLQSGDLQMDFFTPEALERLQSALPHTLEELQRQIRTQRLDMDSLKPHLPDFHLRLNAGQNNILNNFLRTRRMAFRSLEMRGANCDSLPLALGMRIEGLITGGIRLDTVGVSLLQQGARLHYALRMNNAPGNLDHVAAAGVYGDLIRNTATMHLYQRERSGREGLKSGIDISWNDSLVRLSLEPDPQFGFEPWSVNPGNYLVYRFDRQVSADLDLTRNRQRFALHSRPEENGTEEIRLEMAGLGIGTMLELLPSAPPVDGDLSADLAVRLGSDTLALQGRIALAGLSYEQRRFGDLALKAHYAQGRRHLAEAGLAIDSLDVLTARFHYDSKADTPLDARLDLPGIPLERINVFLPEEMLQLSGVLSGTILATGTTEHPLLNGGVRFSGTDIRVPMIGTSFRLAEDTLRFDDSRLRFDRYAILAPNRQSLTIDGQTDLSNLQRITADLRLQAADFQFVNVPRKERTTVYGEAYLDLNTSIRGAIDALVVRGNAALLGGTDINYVMQSSPLEVKEQSQSLVSFVSFNELDNREPFEELPPVRIGGLDVALNVDINNDVKAAVDLSTDGSNRIDLQGGGNLTFTMNPLGDTRLSGRYLLSGGTVRYNPPIIATKIFRIQPGGYVEWLGDLADPSFNITAVESVRANVSTDGQDSRAVNFNISINIRNTLTDLEISFGLSAPEDLTMQNQLNSLTAEQRANQAMNLLIYNTYTGPGTTARVSAENPLNTFIQKELNQWAQNNLKGVDLSFGIDSYGQDDPNGQRTDYSYRLSKNLFSNRIRAVIGGKFSTATDPSQNLKENLIDDISIEYMLDKRDNMYIKVFRHSGYESILEGEITETGVGFVIRKRLSRLGDLFRSSRPHSAKTNSHEDDPQ